MELAPPAPRGMMRPQRDSVLPGGFVVSTAGTLEQTVGVEEALPTSRQPLEMELAQTDKSVTKTLLFVQYCTNQSVVPGSKLECVYHLLHPSHGEVQ